MREYRELKSLSEILDENAIDSYFGFKVPADLISVFEIVNQYETERGYKNLLDTIFNFCRIEGYTARYPQTPPELFPIGSTCVNGDHFGLIIHTQNDEEIMGAFFGPMSFEPVEKLGKGMSEIFQNLLSSEEGDRKKHKDLMKSLGLDIARESTLLESAMGSLKPKEKVNWKWLPTNDGVGVWAPLKFFNPDYYYEDEIMNDVVEKLELSVINEEKSFLATALVILKNLHWEESFNEYCITDILSHMNRIYEKLGRTHLVKVTEKLILEKNRN